ncbi:phage virion morphogenesis protein [Pseudorhodobacter sp.]|uniref:phage virion morphogenesis protein n=1 Tax=Pseudorhodobacter sp. TaxID=1934400 RepID=UPI002648CFD4|nr:phage virion morphogenesis protein [Pseudorhodobacter sp.]MDN5785738.1 phage virion morphogenesis protein [Pseudorhodobacter sp.]
MSGISIEFELDNADATARLQALLNRMDNRGPLFARIGDRLVKSASDNFRAQSGPDGTPWQPLRPATIKVRNARGLTPIHILRARGNLAGSINRQATDDEVRVGTPVEYAAIHQLGGAIQRAARSAKIYRLKDANGTVGRRFVKKKKANLETEVEIPAYAINIPARPFIGVSATDEIGIFEDAEDWLSL